MLFTGCVQLRSSDGRRTGTGPPGETEIQQLNPMREAAIRSVTGWETLAPGSLNLAVKDAVVRELASLQPTFQEPATEVVYPPPYEHIPKIRKAYWYYAATARRGEKTQSVLVRRAMVPVPGVVELFAAVSLTSTLKLAPNDVVNVEVHAAPQARGAGA